MDPILDVVLRHVGDDRFTGVLVKFDGQREGGLSGRLVDTREGLPGCGRFKLGPDNLLLFAVNLVIGWVDSHHRVGQRCGVVDAHLTLPAASRVISTASSSS